MKSGKMVKSVGFFFLQSYNITCFISEICFILHVQILFNLALTFAVHLEKTFFLHFLRSVLITYLITLSLEKEIIVLEKILDPKMDRR